ncbi:MAG: hypothetical protein COY53_09945 [Elusimicrobia bacterium CG_4_10_14_0_8_um_filter_37_32]|nr:MAG: hypothetical protein COS17_03740 [Elusimicrobia bacterium CG02_land_8_20_14_3_00_37_13]PIZ12459.1 MAG: hypothetical protein COY53_09945 [Elusimicrobia bacterium CG_4_10_14_0_8_um_filter_37_32]
MQKVAIEIDVKQIELAIENLDIPNKIRIARRLERETRRERWNNVLSKIDRRYVKSPISEKEISRVCDKVRQERYDKNPESCY